MNKLLASSTVPPKVQSGQNCLGLLESRGLLLKTIEIQRNQKLGEIFDVNVQRLVLFRAVRSLKLCQLITAP